MLKNQNVERFNLEALSFFNLLLTQKLYKGEIPVNKTPIAKCSYFYKEEEDLQVRRLRLPQWPQTAFCPQGYLGMKMDNMKSSNSIKYQSIQL